MGSNEPPGSDEPTEDAGSAADAAVETPTVVWTRWDRTDTRCTGDHAALPIEDIHLHRYCSVIPESRTDPGSDSGHEGYKWFLPPGGLRAGLRHTPLVVLATTLLLLVSAELSPSIAGVSSYLPGIDPLVFLALIGLGVVYITLVMIMNSVDLLDVRDLFRAVIVYGLLVLLLVGTAGSIYLVVTSDDPTALEPNIVYVSGYLLMLYLGGLLVYDGMVRTEYLFVHLPQTLVVEADDETLSEDWPPGGGKQSYAGSVRNLAYHEFMSDLRDRLRDRLPVLGVPTSYVFAILFVVQFAGLWLVGIGPQNLNFWVTLVANVILDLFIVVVAFQFLVLVDGVYNLIEGEYAERVRAELNGPGGSGDSGAGGREEGAGSRPAPKEALSYRPFHPDGRGGFRDIGKFTTRVNVLLILAGLYTVYRLYVQGMRVTFAETATGFPAEIGATIWFVSYVVPVLAYAVAAGAWLYYSFWHLHQKMAREREELYIEHKRREREHGDPSRGIGDLADLTDWIEKRNAPPVWPINNRQLISIVSATVSPIVLSLPNFVL